MGLTCQHCGADNGGETGAPRAASCAACGVSLGSRAGGRAPEYDGYAVGRRVLSLAPAWLLLTVGGFVLLLLFFSWARRHDDGGGADPPRGEGFRNEATNQPPTPTAGGREGTPGARAPRATPDPAAAQGSEGATPAATPGARAAATTDADEANFFSVQVGAFAELSQANEQVSRLRAAGFDARVVESGTATRFRFQVRSGLYETREEAARQAVLLRAGGVSGRTVIVEPEKGRD